MSSEEDENWDNTGFSKFELEEMLEDYAEIFVSNDPDIHRKNKKLPN